MKSERNVLTYCILIKYLPVVIEKIIRGIRLPFMEVKMHFELWSKLLTVQYGEPFVSELQFLIIFIKPVTVTKHQSIFSQHRLKSTRNGNPSIFVKHRSLEIDRCLAKIAGLMNITKNQSFDTNDTPYCKLIRQLWLLLAKENVGM